MSAMQNDRVWIGGGVAAAVLISALAWFGVISPERSNAASLHDQTSTAEIANDALMHQLTQLRADNAAKADLVIQLRSAREALPVRSGLPDFTRQLAGQASSAKVTLLEITVGAITSMAASTPSTPSAADAATAAGPVGKTFVIPITVQAAAPAARLQDFIANIQTDGPRRALVTSAQLVPATSSNSLSIDLGASLTLKCNVFVTPQSAAAEAELQKQLAGSGSN